MAGALFSKATINFGINTQNALQQLQNFQRGFSGGIGQMKTALAGFVGYQGLKGAYEGVKQLVDISDKWRVPVEKMSQMRNLFIAMGGSASEALGVFDTFKNLANQLELHSSGPLKDLSAILRTNLQKKDPEALIAAFRSQWPLLGNDDQEEVLKMLGTDSVGIRNILRANNEEFAAAQYAARHMPMVSAEDAKAVREITKSSNQIANNTEKILSRVNNLVTVPALDAVRGATNLVANPGNASTKDALGALATIGTAGAAAAISGALTKKAGAAIAQGTGWSMVGKAGTAAGAAGGAAASALGVLGTGLGIGLLFNHVANLATDNKDARDARLNRLQVGKYSNLEQYWQDLAWTMRDVETGNGLLFGNSAISNAELAKSEELLGRRVAEFARAAKMAYPEKYNTNVLNNELFREMLSKYGNTVSQTINIYGNADPETTRRAARDGVTQALGGVVMQSVSGAQGY